jgi:hypothetical protein
VLCTGQEQQVSSLALHHGSWLSVWELSVPRQAAVRTSGLHEGYLQSVALLAGHPFGLEAEHLRIGLKTSGLPAG